MSHTQTIKWHITRAMMTLSFVVAVLAIVTLTIYEAKSFEERQKTKVEMLVTILTENAKTILLFGDQESANSFLAPLKNDLSIVDAFMLTKNGEVLGSYRVNYTAPFPVINVSSLGEEPLAYEERNAMVRIHPIFQKGVFLGAMYLKTSAKELERFFWQLGIVGGIALTLILIMAFILAQYLQRAISKPILELDQITKSLSQNHDFSLQVPVKGQKEVASLYASFNFLLKQINKHEWQRDQQTTRLQENEERYRLVSDHVPIMIALLDTDLKHILTNPPFKQFTHRENQELRGKHICEILGEDFYQIMKPDLHRAIQGQIVEIKKPICLAHISEREQWVEGAFVPLVSELGSIEGIYIFLQNITARKKAEDAQIELLKEIRALNARIFSVQEHERAELARNLHDSIGQLLTVLHVSLRRIEQVVADPPKVQQICQKSQMILKDILTNVRNTSIHLHQSLLEDVGLAAAIQWYVENQAKLMQWSVDMDQPDVLPTLEHSTALSIYRLVQEAITNIIRHAEATHVTVRLRQKRQRISLLIQDNGKGFEVSRSKIPPPKSQHFGILGMTERAYAVGGKFVIKPRLGRGTIILVNFPIKKSQEIQDVCDDEYTHIL